MYSIPYGTVLKLRELGIEEKEARISGRIVPHIIVGEKPFRHEFAIIDNGFVNNHFWRFLSGGLANDFDFGDNALPIEMTILDVSCFITNAKGQKLGFLIKADVGLLEKVFRAFYPGRYSDIKVIDKRRETLQGAIDRLNTQKEEANRRYQEESARLEEKISQITTKIYSK